MSEDKNYTVLVVEDETSLLETLEYNLRHQGYNVYTASDGLKALDIARQKKPDVIVLDVMLPSMDGIEVCRTLRQEMNVPIIMLTARAEEVDKIVGLEVGADDYMTKPFSMRELLVRVKALLRRVRLTREEVTTIQVANNNPSTTNEQLIFGNLSIDVERREVRCRDEVVYLKPKEFELLLFFARNRGIALSRTQILEKVWGWDFDGGSRTVDVHTRWLREKIEEEPANPGRLVTVRGVGYRFDG